MVTFEEYQRSALSFADTSEQAHFEKPSFRYKNKIFATYWPTGNLAMLLLPLNQQSVFCAYDTSIFYPVDGAWGKRGATLIQLKKVRKDMFRDALNCAYANIRDKHAPKKKTK